MNTTTTQQRQEALALANVTRCAIAEFRREVRNAGTQRGTELVADVIENNHADRVFGAARVGQLIRAIPSFGDDKVHRTLATAGVRSPDRKLRDLTERQRTAVVDGLEHQLDRWLHYRAKNRSGRERHAAGVSHVV